MGENKDRNRSITGFILIAIGAWAALAPFLVSDWVGELQSGHVLLTIVPGAMAALGGLVMLGGRRLLRVGGGLALAGGLWLVAGPLVYALLAGPDLGTSESGLSVPMIQWLPFFFGAGVLVSFLSSYAAGFLPSLEFGEEAWKGTATATTRKRVPLPAERPRRQRGIGEGVPQPADHAHAKRSARREG